jgi:hypothetical protein
MDNKRGCGRTNARLRANNLPLFYEKPGKIANIGQSVAWLEHVLVERCDNLCDS